MKYYSCKVYCKHFFVIMLLLPFICGAQRIKLNEYDKFIKQRRIETFPVAIKEAADIKMAISFSALGPVAYLKLSGSGIGASLIDVNDKAVFLLANGSTVTATSKGYQNYDLSSAEINYSHDYVLTISDLEKLSKHNLTALQKSRSDKMDEVVVSKENAEKIRKLSALFVEELKKRQGDIQVEKQLTVRTAGFPGGYEAWMKFLRRNLKPPIELGIGEKKTIVVQFLVNANGTVDDFQIIQSGGLAFDNEAIRVLKRMPKWKSAIENERPTDAVVTQPITFFRADPTATVQ